jgi:hypothetical protein
MKAGQTQPAGLIKNTLTREINQVKGQRQCQKYTLLKNMQSNTKN